ncbi:glutamine amidotransferase [Fodinibius salinus]|uniref:Imidazole glycerol phosphate synthase subunit HisH n=1 Tax=Fodinibius salinus TaxID=860790 RepID=A0A5D3YJS8_9BACT|nr:imidazole glycerol phosphate synthase subunit HisH [Fodinibius salinus]TYP91982.1 glutamine amidotransferase [Fodinibius salinus]
MIAIINYEAGNLASVSNALSRLNANHIVTNQKEELNQAEGIIFPGVGHAEPAMESLRTNELDQWLKDTNKPVLGICLGMQLLYESSEEGNSEGLGLIPGTLKKFNSETKKVPHMGWNTFTEVNTDHPLVSNFDDSEYFYFVHSYFAPINKYSIANCHYIQDFTAVVSKGNYMGVQFHPEKSGKAGSLLLQNFLDYVHYTDLET